MKYLMISLVGVCLLLTSVPAMADQAADEAAIRKLIEQDNEAFNKHDAKAMAVACAKNYESWNGKRKGPAAFEKMMAEYFANQKDVQAKELEVIGIIFLTPDVAIYKSRKQYTNRLDADGKPLPTGKILAASVFVKENGKWLWAADFDRTIEE